MLVFPLQSFFFQSKSGVKGETGSILAILKHWTLPARDSAWQYVRWLHVTERTFDEMEPSKWQSRNPGSNATQFLKELHFRCQRYFEEEKIKRARILVLTFYRKIKTLTMAIRYGWRNRKIFHLVTFRNEETLELLNKLFWSRFTKFTGVRCFRLEAAFRNPS